MEKNSLKTNIMFYRLSGKKGFPRKVHRKALIDYGEQFNIPMEHHNPNANDTRPHWNLERSQTKLFEETKESE